jgi:hypothetical protein
LGDIGFGMERQQTGIGGGPKPGVTSQVPL